MNKYDKASKYTKQVHFGFILKMGNEKDYIAGYDEGFKDAIKLLNNYLGAKINLDLIEELKDKSDGS